MMYVKKSPVFGLFPFNSLCHPLVFQLVKLNAFLPLRWPALNLSQDEVIENYQPEYFRSLSWNKIQQAFSQFVNMLEYK